METTFVIKPEELDNNFLESLKQLFKKSRTLQITVSNAEDFGLLVKETKSEYLLRLEKAAQNIEEERVILKEEDFDKLSLELLER